jgi:PIN domain nuclease of toxin-antitoxin system
MKMLLDTHALVWALSDPERLPVALRGAIEARSNIVYVSAASVWEIAIKTAIGRIDLPIEDLSGAIAESGFLELPVTIAHAGGVRALPQHHRDPFDRMLAVQSAAENLILASRDPVFSLYGISTIWD